MANHNALAAELIAYATEHYEDGGWDVLVECFSPGEIATTLAENGATTLAEAITAYAGAIDVWADRQADARNSAF